MQKKKSYRALERENRQLREQFQPTLARIQKAAEQVLMEQVELATNAALGQLILEQIVKDVAYKKITAGEAKLWLETTWHKRHDEEAGETYEEQCEFLGVDPEQLRERFNDIDKALTEDAGDRLIKLFMNFSQGAANAVE